MVLTENVEIRVTRQMDGVNYFILPSVRKFIKELFPESNPANSVFLRYDLQENPENGQGTPEKYIFPLLFGIDDQKLWTKLKEVSFIDSQSDQVIKAIHKSE
ncbi:MAG: hypothetical protein H6581_12835 [Bacteroidia bacterium]|nr:hypothetical protein [Bacteroidia bacterium]